MSLAERFNLPEIDRTPRPLAEHLDPNIAMAAMRRYETKPTPRGWLRSAWHFAEYGLNHEARYSEEYFNTTSYLIGMILNKYGYSNEQDVLLGALTLSTYVPLFEKRARFEEITEEDSGDVYQSLGAMIQYLRPLEIDEPPQWRMVEIGVLALSARSRQPQLLLYPSSPREEGSNIADLNHDYYYIENGNKLPLQQKLVPIEKTYDEWVRVLVLEPLVDKALKVAGMRPEEMELRDKMNYLLALITSETSGTGLSREERTFLNFMTEAVVSHRSESIEELKAA